MHYHKKKNIVYKLSKIYFQRRPTTRNPDVKYINSNLINIECVIPETSAIYVNARNKHSFKMNEVYFRDNFILSVDLSFREQQMR